MTEPEKTHMSNTVANGTDNKNDAVWIKAFSETYPTLSMSVDWHYEKVLCKILV